jgi:predicted ribosomally synthesized peptide with nif11-like leader
MQDQTTMSQNNVIKFYREVVESNEQLQEQLGAAEDGPTFLDLAVRLGQERGYTFTGEDVEAFMNSQRGEAELSEEELEAVAGGRRRCNANTRVTICLGVTRYCWIATC